MIWRVHFIVASTQGAMKKKKKKGDIHALEFPCFKLISTLFESTCSSYVPKIEAGIIQARPAFLLSHLSRPGKVVIFSGSAVFLNPRPSLRGRSARSLHLRAVVSARHLWQVPSLPVVTFGDPPPPVPNPSRTEHVARAITTDLGLPVS